VSVEPDRASPADDDLRWISAQVEEALADAVPVDAGAALLVGAVAAALPVLLALLVVLHALVH